MGLLTEITHLLSRLHEVQVLDVSWQKEFSERQVIGKKWIYLERNIDNVVTQVRVAPGYRAASFYRGG